MAFVTLLNVIDAAGPYWPRVADADPAGGPQAWRTFPRYAEVLAAAKAEADGDAVWARWAPGVPHGPDGHVQVDVSEANDAAWGSSVLDEEAPVVTILTPTEDDTFETDEETITLTGTATDNVGVTEVIGVNLSTVEEVPATGTDSWSVEIPLDLGSNLLHVVARDAEMSSGFDEIIVTRVAPTLDFSQVTLLLHAEGANNGTVHTDSSSYAHTMTAAGGNCPTVTTEKKYGSTSFSYGSAESMSAPNGTEFDMSTGDFTLEGWFYATTGLIGVLEVDLFTKSATAPYPWRVYVPTTKKLTAKGTDDASAEVFSFVDSADFPMDQWVHIALVRSGNNFMLFKNGVQVSTTDTSAATLAVNTAVVRIGGPAPGVSNWFGYIDEVRIAKGFAVYTADFTPPIAAFPDA